MDWALHDHQPDQQGSEPQLEQLQVFWRLVGPSARPVTCALYRTAAGLEVRAERSADDLIRSQLVPSAPAGELYAEDWKAAILAVGSFVELPAQVTNH